MVKKNLLILTASFYLQLVTSVWTIPLQGKIKLMRLRDESLAANEIKRQKRSTTSDSYTAFLYTRHTSKLVKVTAKKINALAPNQKDKYAELILTKLGLKGEHSIKGKESKKFVCLNSEGHVVLKDTYNQLECMFHMITHKSGYITFRSVHNATWHLGFKKKGEVRHGHKTKHHHHAAWMMIMYPTRKPQTL